MYIPLNPSFTIYNWGLRGSELYRNVFLMYIVKLGLTGVYIFFLTADKKHRLWVLVRTSSPRRGGSNEYPQSVFSRNMKISDFFFM